MTSDQNTSDGIAVFRSATDETVADVRQDATAVEQVVGDVDKAVTDAKSLDITSVVADGEHTIDDVHALVLDVKRTVDSIKPLIEKAGPALDAIVDEVKDKGITGLIPLVLAAFRG